MRKLSAILLTIISVSNICVAQGVTEDENWLKGFRTEADYFQKLEYWEPKGFSLGDVVEGKQRLALIRQFAPQNEWEGLYYANAAIGDSKFVWNAKGGFFSFYFYHTLKSFYFGSAKNSLGFVELGFEKLAFSQTHKKLGSTSKLVKVRIDETHFLVPENRLEDFCERAAGLSKSLSDFNYYWIKEEDMQKRRDGLPVLHLEYAKFLRYPVEARIIRIGKKEIVPNEQSTKEYNFDDIHYPVTLNVGKDKKLKKDMNFFVKDLGEWIQLTQSFKSDQMGLYGEILTKMLESSVGIVKEEVVKLPLAKTLKLV